MHLPTPGRVTSSAAGPSPPSSRAEGGRPRWRAATSDPEAEHAVIAERIARPVTVAVVDHYAIGADWQRAAGAWAERMMAIDDLADQFQAVDLLLNQNPGPGPSRYRGLVPPAARILAGPTYALVRPEFAAMRLRARNKRSVHRILVFLS